MDINKYNHRKNVACALVIFAALTANAFALSYVQQMADHIEYVDALRGVFGAAIFNEIWALGTLIASLCMHMEKKEHHQKLDMVANWTTMSALSIFCLNIAGAVLNHLSMMELKAKIEGN
eukprot:TRINITY_DN6320_c0_g1_i1.p2 TRINITY_DN6320_c0_g1~~TRINITY_DN6320_c0_g1_i1.p2  ORF type:complete len:139 (-),score=36.20 TRINITY_DN6320_c0_g1_i1:62-421(-)